MTLAKFYKATKDSVDENPQEAGSIYFTTDTQEIIVDIPNGERTSFGKPFDLIAVTDDEVDSMFNKYFD